MKTFNWFNKEKQSILDALSYQTKKAYFVGGAVRDSLYYGDIVLEDFDIATPYTPQEVMEITQKHNWKCILTGVEHGTVTLIVNKEVYEVTTFRKDTKPDGRRSEVIFTQNVYEDAKRRDLTINAIYLDRNQEIFDPWKGYDDLQNKVVKFIGNADMRIQEDYLRMLRYFRFHTVYGGNIWNQEAMQACIKHRNKINVLSKERITKEIFKILSYKKILGTLTKLNEINLIESLFSQSNWKKHIMLTEKLSHQYHFSPLSKYALLTSQTHHVIFSRKEKKIFNLMDKNISFLPTQKEFKPFLYMWGNENIREIFFVLAIKYTVENSYQTKILTDWLQKFCNYNFTLPKFPILAKKLIPKNLNKYSGPIMKEFTQWWLQNKLPDNKENITEQVRKIVLKYNNDKNKS